MRVGQGKVEVKYLLIGNSGLGQAVVLREDVTEKGEKRGWLCPSQLRVSVKPSLHYEKIAESADIKASATGNG
jgi:hypothetical protein